METERDINNRWGNWLDQSSYCSCPQGQFTADKQMETERDINNRWGNWLDQSTVVSLGATDTDKQIDINNRWGNCPVTVAVPGANWQLTNKWKQRETLTTGEVTD